MAATCSNVSAATCWPAARGPPSRYAVTVGRGGSAHTVGKVISMVTVYAPGRYAAVAVARAVVSGALKHQALSPSQRAMPAVQRLKERYCLNWS